MKSEGHPDYHTVTIKMTDGTTYQTRTTWGKEGDVMNLDIDPLTHPAWLGGNSGKVIEKGALSKFEKRFAGFGLSSGETQKK